MSFVLAWPASFSIAPVSAECADGAFVMPCLVSDVIVDGASAMAGAFGRVSEVESGKLSLN